MIVCLGWGSLIWDIDGLPVEKLKRNLPIPPWVLSPEGGDVGDWKPDGPEVRVEFVRQSSCDRLTLVLYDAAERQPCLWARMTVGTPNEAVRALTKREYRKIPEEKIDDWSKINIGRWSKGKAAPTPIPSLGVWANDRNIEHVIWTKLRPKFCSLPVAPTEDQAVAYLRRLSGKKRAAEAEKYVRRAPPQIDTAYRRRIIRCLGWTPVA